MNMKIDKVNNGNLDSKPSLERGIKILIGFRHQKVNLPLNMNV